jgi:O-antigen/teichoic acid export membrane protein
VGADTALTGVMAAAAAGGNYAFRLVVLGILATPEQAGLYQLMLAYLSMASSLADFGLSSSLMPRLAVARGPNSPALRASVVLRTATIAITWIGLDLYLWLSGHGELLMPINIAFVGTFISSRLLGMRNTTELLWRLKGRSWINAAFVVLDSLLGLLALLFVAQYTTVTVTTVAIIWTATALPGFVLSLLPLLPELRRSERLWRPIPARYYRAFAMSAYPVGFTLFIGQISGQLETLVLNWAGTLADVGYYGVSIAPLNGVLFIPSVVGVGLGPVVSQLFRGARGDISLAWFTSMATRLIGLIAIAITGTAIVFADELLKLFPAAYAGGGYIVRLYALTTALVFLVVVYDGFLIAIEYRRRLLTGAVGTLILALVLEVMLITRFGVTGLLVAKMIALVCLIAFQLVSFPREMRSGALAGLGRVLIPVAAFAVAYVATQELALAWRAVATIGGVLATVALFRTISFDEIRRIRSVGLS